MTGDNGLLTKASNAKKANEEATALEKIQVEVAGSYGLDGKIDIDNQLNQNLKRIDGLTYNGDLLSNINKITKLPAIVKLSGFSYTIQEDGSVGREKTVEDYPEIAVNTLATENSKYISNGKIAIIPKGYTISNDTTEQSIDTGLVIKRNGNEWVWIPVSATDLAVMYTEDATGWTMSGTDVVTKYKTNSEIISGKTRTNPGLTSDPYYREPDVLNNDSYNLSNAGLGANIGEAATKLRDDYKAMIDSVKKNGGFFVGRYELSSAGTKKNQASLTNTNWYNLYKACKDIDSTGVETRMIWGCQWDQVCKFINTLGDKVSLTDSTSYGNYDNSSGNANVSGKGSKQVTGYSDYWKANNIYDIAGNCWEWTQEAYNTGKRARRGGCYYNNGVATPVSQLDNSIPTDTGDGISSRPVLYVK